MHFPQAHVLSAQSEGRGPQNPHFITCSILKVDYLISKPLPP